MCGRFTLRTPASVVAEAFGLAEMAAFAPRFNVAPSQAAAVVRRAPAAGGAGLASASAGHWQSQCHTAPGGQRQLAWLRWGLVPSWAGDPAIGNRLINARAETAAEKPAFRAAFRNRRCLIVADGFYEWQRAGNRKQPYFFHLRDDRPFAFAGLWEIWEGPDRSRVESCTLLTTVANELVRPIHDRMPAILAAADYAPWLDAAVAEPKRLASLLGPYPSEAMAAYAVGPRVNSPGNDDPGCIEPAAG